MKKVEFTLIIIFILSFVLKPFSADISIYSFLISFFGLLLLYLCLGFALFNNIRFRDFLKKDAYTNIKSKHLLMGVGLSLIIILLFTAIIFKLQHWPMSSSMLIVATCMLGVTAITGIVKQRRGEAGTFFVLNLPRTSFYFSVGLFSLW